MRYLLSPFPATQLPSSNDQRMIFWRSLILKTNTELKRPVFTERELADLFKWNGTPPSCLPLVLQAMEKNGEIRRFSEEAVDSGGDQGWLGWGAGVLAKPVAWAWNSYYGPPQYEGKYIMLAAVKVSSYKSCQEHVKNQGGGGGGGGGGGEESVYRIRLMFRGGYSFTYFASRFQIKNREN